MCKHNPCVSWNLLFQISSTSILVKNENTHIVKTAVEQPRSHAMSKLMCYNNIN